jgi:hypothetical protein
MRQDQYLNSDFQSRGDEVKTFVKNLSEKEAADLTAIIMRYLSYRKETIEAALIVSVDKGLISFDLKEKLWDQIDANFDSQEKTVRNYKWESENAFAKYVAAYTDEEIYNILEDPKEIVIDVYHAFLLIAKERELISDDDFEKYYEDAKIGRNGEEVNMQYDIADLFRSQETVSEEPGVDEIEAEREKYWKCPKCNEMVGMEFGVCWNCAAEVPEVIEHPDIQAVLKERVNSRNYTLAGIGIRLIGAGVLVIVLDLFRHYKYSSYIASHLGGYIFGGFFIVLGIGFLAYKAFFKSGKD